MSVILVMTTHRSDGLKKANKGVRYDKFRILLASQLSDDLLNFATESAIKYFLTVLRGVHYMVFALPINMG